VSEGSTAVIVLAAGGSSRLGQPKQLVPWRGSTLLRHAARQALDAALGSVIVVLGAEREGSMATLEGLEVGIIENEQWREGLSSSIAAGIAHLETAVTGCVLTTCDQYLVPADHLRALAQAGQQNRAGIAASRYDDTLGVPAYFARIHFRKLASLRGDQGAKSLILGEPDAAAISFEAAKFDVDQSIDRPGGGPYDALPPQSRS
jgi:molybdenum cofactor cytidylyltransferase